MKKFLIVIALFCLSLLCACEGFAKSDVKRIALKDYDAETAVETVIGEFCYEDYTIVVTKDDGSKKEIALKESMISEEDQLKFYQEGSHVVTVTYKGASVEIRVNVSRKTFHESVVLKDFTAVYTGEKYVVSVEGKIPNGTNIIYPQGNVFQNAGTYSMSAILQCDGYESLSLTAKVVIEKAEYDVSNALLYNKTVVYDQDYHEISVQGQPIKDANGNVVSHEPYSLPRGVSVSYTITKIKDGAGNTLPEQEPNNENRAMDAGTYKVCAKYKGDSLNYNTVSESVAYLTIERAVYDMSDIVMTDDSGVYTGETYSIAVPDVDNIPNSIAITYEIMQIKDGNGHDVEGEFIAGNNAVNAGIYQVRAIFNVTGKNASNYMAYPLETYAYLTIEQASYDEIMENVHVDPIYTDYVDGESYSILIDGILPYDVQPEFIVRNEIGEVIQGSTNGLTFTFQTQRAGRYTCVVEFHHENENYEEIPPKNSFIDIVTDIELVSLSYDGQRITQGKPLTLEGDTFDYAKMVVVIEEGGVEREIVLAESMVYHVTKEKTSVESTLTDVVLYCAYEEFAFKITYSYTPGG